MVANKIVYFFHDQTRVKRVFGSFMINAYVHTTPEDYPSTTVTKPLYRNPIKRFNHFCVESSKYNSDTIYL